MTDRADRDPTPEALVAKSGAGKVSLPELPTYLVIQQQLIDARDMLDREVSRLKRMHAFNAQALRLANDNEIIQAVGEAIVNIFELEFGICWLLDESGKVPQAIGAFGIQSEAVEMQKAGVRLATFMASTSGLQVKVLEPAVLAEIAPGLAIEQAICAHWPDAEGRASGLILGGNTTVGTRFFDAVTPELARDHGIFAQQLAAQMGTGKARATIEQQMAELTRERSVLRTLIGTLPDLIWLKDPEGVYLACNPPLRAVFWCQQGRDRRQDGLRFCRHSAWRFLSG